jgi:hypothetical protein
MGIRFAEAQFALPSVRRFLADITSELASRRNVVVLLPRQVTAERFAEVLWEELERRTFDCGEIRLPARPPQGSPELLICRHFSIPVESPDPDDLIAALHESPSLPQVTFLKGLDAMDWTARQQWLSFLTRFAQARSTISVSRQTGTTMCVVAAAAPLLPILPEPDAALVFRWWWGFPSNLEIHFLCREVAGEPDGPASQWREAVLVALAGTDAALLDYLWSDSDDSLENKKELLAWWAEQLGWRFESLDENGSTKVSGLLDSHGRSPAPPLRYRQLWAQGALYSTVDGGICLHPAALQITHREHQLNHRLWAAQSSLVLSWLNLVRLRVCEILSAKYPADWARRWSLPTDSRQAERLDESSMHCEWSHLKHLLANQYELRSERGLLPLVEKAHTLRNRLAHQLLVSLEDVREFWAEALRTLPPDGIKADGRSKSVAGWNA